MSAWNYTIAGAPEYAQVEITVPRGKTLRAEASAMAAMDPQLTMKTKIKGGFKRFLVKESLFINEFSAEAASGNIILAPGSLGDICHRFLKGETLYLQASSFLASSEGVQTDTKFEGLTQTFFSGEHMFLIKCHGHGNLWFNTFGAIFEVPVTGSYVVDTGHIVAFSEGLSYNISRVGGYKSLFFSGEGFVCRFSGEGTVWVQTRKLPTLLGWLHPFRRVRKRKSN